MEEEKPSSNGIDGGPTEEAIPDVPAPLDFGEKRKKKKKKDLGAEGAEEANFVDGSGKLFEKGAVYPYEELLCYIQTLINKNNPDLNCGAKKYCIKPPQVVRVGSKKVAWINFNDICTFMNRQHDHLYHFVVAELGAQGSFALDGQLVLKGKFGQRHVEALLRKYIKEYVTCSMCKSPNTVLEKDRCTRLFNLHCDACGANRSVTSIRSGFHAVSRGERRKQKMT